MTVITEVRRAGRVVLVDEDGAVLLMSGRDPIGPGERFWFVPGGGAEEGEAVEEAACRELDEELGIPIDPSQLGPVVWERRVIFDFAGSSYDQHERFWVVRTQRFVPAPKALTALEERMATGARWWTLQELACAKGPVHPARLAALLADWSVQGPPAEPLLIE